MVDLPKFITIIKAHNILWALIITADFSVIETQCDYNHCELKNINFDSTLSLNEIYLTKILETTDIGIDLLKAKDPNCENYRELEIVLLSENLGIWDNPTSWFGNNVISEKDFDFENLKWKEEFKRHYVAYPNLEIPMEISIWKPENGLTSITITIPKSREIHPKDSSIIKFNLLDINKLKLKDQELYDNGTKIIDYINDK